MRAMTWGPAKGGADFVISTARISTPVGPGNAAWAASRHEMVDKAVLNEYLSESDQLLDSLLADLEQLASWARPDPSRSEKSTGTPPELINRIFRNVHSLKGLSGMMGMTSVKSLAHE